MKFPQTMPTPLLAILAWLAGYSTDAPHAETPPAGSADLAVLDGSLLEIDMMEINEASVVLTVLDGEIVYDATDLRSEP